MRVAQILESRGFPLLVASGCDVAALPSKLIQTSFYEVTEEKAPENFTAKSLKPGMCLVYTKDDIFIDAVKAHFDTMLRPEAFSGSTMWSSIQAAGSQFEVITIDSNMLGSITFKGYINIAYLEAGARGHLITRRVKIK